MSDNEEYSAGYSDKYDEQMSDTESSSGVFDEPDRPEDGLDQPDDITLSRADDKSDPYMTMSGDDTLATESEMPSELPSEVPSEVTPVRRSYRRSVSGGVKTSKKAKVDPLYLQRLIDKDLRERISLDAFKQDKIVTMIKNTVNIKCKSCGSDNVFVESKQVRSADEAMTKFYTCLNCGNKWRFD